MSSLLIVLLSSVLVTTLVLAHVPHWRPFASTATIFDGARAMSVAFLIAVPTSAALSWLLAELLLKQGGLDYLRTPAFVGVILTIAPLVEWILHRDGRLLPQRPGFALLLTTNSALLGVALLAELRGATFAGALLLAGGAAAALALLLVAFAALYERVRYADVPAPFREAPIALVTAGIMALAFMGFMGFVRE